jgi:hypothetical protein
MRQSSVAREKSVGGSSRSERKSSSGWRWIVAGFVVLFVVHHDFWWWEDRTLVLGFLPIGLAYHATFSVAAGLLWALATRYAWPDHIEAWAEQSSRALRSSEPVPGHEEGRP